MENDIPTMPKHFCSELSESRNGALLHTKNIYYFPFLGRTIDAAEMNKNCQ